MFAADDLVVGSATTDITAPVGYRLCGYFNERPSTGIHDPLQAKVIYLRQGKTEVAIVCCDLIGIDHDVTALCRQRLQKELDLPPNHVLIHGTHSHTGPLFYGALRDHLHRQAVEKHGSDPLEKIDYVQFLADKITAAVKTARETAAVSQIREATGEETTISFNRRFQLKDGSVRFNPGRFNPNIDRVLGPIDPQVGLLTFAKKEAPNPFAALTVFALHLDTVGGTEYSADYPQYLEQTLRTQFGPQFNSLFGNGTCGDINHIDVAHEQPQKGQEMAQHIGTKLGQSVLKAAATLRQVEQPALAVRSTLVRAPMQQYDENQLAWARKNIFQVGQRTLSFLEQVEACKILDCQLRGSNDVWPLEVQVIRFNNDVALVAIPGEVFVELGLWIKQYSPFRHTLVMELCNDNPAYIPTRKAFAEGSYETINSRIQAGGGEMMAAEAVRLLRELK